MSRSFSISTNPAVKEAPGWAGRLVPSDQEKVCKMLCTSKLLRLEIHDSTMWPVENSPEPATALSSRTLDIWYVYRRTDHRKFIWIFFQLLPKCSLGSSPCFVRQFLWKYAKSESWLMLRFLKSVPLTIQRKESEERERPQQIVGEGVLEHFIFKTFRLGLHFFRAYTETERYRKFMMNAFSLGNCKFTSTGYC